MSRITQSYGTSNSDDISMIDWNWKSKKIFKANLTIFKPKALHRTILDQCNLYLQSCLYHSCILSVIQLCKFCRSDFSICISFFSITFFQFSNCQFYECVQRRWKQTNEMKGNKQTRDLHNFYSNQIKIHRFFLYQLRRIKGVMDVDSKWRIRLLIDGNFSRWSLYFYYL